MTDILLTGNKKAIIVPPMKSGKTGAKSVRTKKRCADGGLAENNRFKATTMQIPVEALFDEAPQIEHITHLQVLVPGKPPFSVPLSDGETKIGRGSECQIHLPLANVSRVHCRILPQEEDFLLEDMDSTNGTLVNNVRIIRCILRDDDQIRVGEAKILFIRQKARK
jgi:hypothetical protein